MSRIFLLLFLLFVSNSLTDAGYSLRTKSDLPPEAVALWLPSMLHEYENLADLLMESTHTPGAAIAIVKNGEVVMSKGFGTRAATSNEAIDENTIFRLGSVSKGFAPVLTGLLVEDGLLNWDDKVTKYLPNFYLAEKKNTEDLTIRNLLSHTTSLPKHAYTNLIEEGYSFDEMVEEL
ncbi:MAG: serine hydrolase domain-containing protein, partial [Chitinophagales bacterium]